jgi:predicted dehydrogenase
MITSWFIHDLTLERPGASVKHIVQALGSSSKEKAAKFLEKHAPSASPSLYGSYEEVYNDPNVDVVYIGTPHSLHLKNALDAIAAGKNVLCEKPFTINGKETEQIITAAAAKNVFVMEAVWTRFFPITKVLQKLVHEEKIIGNVSRVFVDFGIDMPIASMEPSARTANHTLGAGSLLDIGIYTLTFASIILDQHPANAGAPAPTIASSMTLTGGADEITSIILNYSQLKAHAILTTSMLFKSAKTFCRIEGSRGEIVVGGEATSRPEFLIIREVDKEERRLDFGITGWGFHWEADAVALDILAGKKESIVMPLAESLRMMQTMDSIRKANGLVYPQDS